MVKPLLEYLFPGSAVEAPSRTRALTWKVVKLDGPVTKEIGLDVEYGVVISADKMLEKTQTLLFCPLIRGIGKDGSPLELMPWHVKVEIEDDKSGRLARVDYGEIFMSTKIVLPITRNEIDGDGRSRGWIDKRSQRAAAEKFKDWLPSFRDLARS